MKLQNKTAAIIGVGQIGGSLGLSFKKANLFFKINGYDRNSHRLKLAETFLDNCFDRAEEAIQKSDIIILASPVHSIIKTLEFGFENFPDKLYSDVGSTKSPMIELSATYQNVRYIGGHPLAGSEKKGESGWDASLFKGKPYFVIHNQHQSKQDERLIIEMIKSIGAKPISISAKEHDRMVAATSHFPLLLSLAMMSTFSEREKKLTPFIGTGFQSVTRLSGGAPEMGKDLLMSNRQNILLELEIFSAKLSELKELIENEDGISLLQQMKHYRDLYWKTVEKSK